MKQVQYVAGFLFDYADCRVVLIEKQRPKWQAGKLNAVGGHVEVGETRAQAMHREFLEETGVEVREWHHFVTLTGENDVAWTAHFFCAFDTAALLAVRDGEQQTDELVSVFDIHSLNYQTTIPNLRWLIPMALSMRHESAQRFTVTEHYTDLRFTASDETTKRDAPLAAPVRLT